MDTAWVPPSLGSTMEEIRARPPNYHYSTMEYDYIFTPTTFTKKEIPSGGRVNMYGEPIVFRHQRERLENCHAALQFIRTWTTIPVPEVLDFSEKEGRLSLTLRRINGIMLEDLEDDQFARASKNVDKYIRDHVLPQLSCLRSSRLGSLVGTIIPPGRIQRLDDRRDWPNRYAEARETFVFCHNDLSQPNIFLDPDSLEVISIIDWEWSGFYPAEFEAPLWTKPVMEFHHNPDPPAQLEILREKLLRRGKKQLGTMRT